jgi:Rrf2 family protein
MRVSAKAHYACVAMLELAASYGEPQPVRIKAIADAHGLDQRFLVQILLQLKTAGLVASFRGAAGGYQLARAPEAISLAEIVGAVEKREPAPGAALAGSTRSAAVEVLLGVWQDLQAREQLALQRLSLAELLRRTQDTHALTYQI